MKETIQERKQKAKAFRKSVTRNDLGKWKLERGRDLAVRLIHGQEETRVQKLIPLRHERMSNSPFTFFRGAAIVQAHDLSTTPSTTFRVQAVGDAHISNFGLFASPERRMIFDINDFDETTPAPFDCDVKRLAASIEICGRDRAFDKEVRREAVYEAMRVYRQTMRTFSEMGNLEVWYSHLDIEKLLNNELDLLDQESQKNVKVAVDSKMRKNVKETIEKALQKNSDRALRKFTEIADGKIRIKNEPPLIVPMRNLIPEDINIYGFRYSLEQAFSVYRQTLPVERRGILDQYTPLEMAHKVVGVGSVGMKAWILVMLGRENGDPLVLQIKEARASVLEPYFGKSNYSHAGRRVVEGQRAIQTAGDILLGWMHLTAQDGHINDYYVRQLWDGKGSFDLSKIRKRGLIGLASMCAWTLAHAHAKTGDRHAIGAYLGKSDAFEEAMVDYAYTYADQNESDYEIFLKAIQQ